MGYQTDKKQILLLSDDWGSVRIKSKEDQADLIKKGFKVASRFDQFDSLETNEDLELLFEVLTKYKDHNGNHPCITAVTNVANPDFKKIKESDFQEYHYETIASTYLRYPDSDRVLNLTHEGIQNKIFIPQSHGREHVQVNWWMEELQNKDSFASKFFENEFFFMNQKYLCSPKRNRDLAAAFDLINLGDLNSHKNIVAIKEASGDLSQIAKIARLCPAGFDIYSGNDDQILPVLSLGGAGVISVVANILPDETHQICELYFNGMTNAATKLQLDMLDIINALFIETNPIPVKAALEIMGKINGELRLPLIPISDSNRELLIESIKKFSIIQMNG